MNTPSYVPRVMESLMPCGYDVRVRVEDGYEESSAVVVVNDRKNYVVLQQSGASRYRNRTAKNELGRIWSVGKGECRAVRCWYRKS